MKKYILFSSLIVSSIAFANETKTESRKPSGNDTNSVKVERFETSTGISFGEKWTDSNGTICYVVYVGSPPNGTVSMSCVGKK